ncbi:21290_t:CDS:2, partial [Racocetra persica]
HVPETSDEPTFEDVMTLWIAVMLWCARLLTSQDPRVRLRRAACEGNLHLIKRLIAKTNLQNPDPVNGWTTLMYATRYGHDRVVEYLLNNGHEEIELSRDFDNNTILMVASQYNFVE